MEFKGTKTKWEVAGEYKTFVYSLRNSKRNAFSFSINNDGNIPLEELQANAKLIIKSLEMLDFIKHVYNSMPKGSTLQTKAEKLIKEATTI